MIKRVSGSAPVSVPPSVDSEPVTQIAPEAAKPAEDNALAKKNRQPGVYRTSNVTDAFLHRYMRTVAGNDVLPNDAKQYTYLWVAGFIESDGIDLRGNANALRALGLNVKDVNVSARLSLADNVAMVKQAIVDAASNGQQVVLLGYSWGGVAVADAIAQYPELKPHVRGVGTVNAPYGGNAFVTELMGKSTKKVVELGFERLLGGHKDALGAQTIEARQRHNAANPYPEDVPTVSLASRSLGVSSAFKANEVFLRARGHGDNDGFVSVDKSMLPGSARVVVDGVDHLGSANKPHIGTEARLEPGAMAVALTSLVLQRASTPTENNDAFFEARNASAVRELPQFEVIYRDPDKFVADMKQRFARQKAADPSNPYGFDFSELGLPLLRDMDKALGEELAKSSHPYLRELREEVQSHIEDGKIDYRRAIELSRFVSRAMGYFEIKGLTKKDRAMLSLDRLQLGFRDIRIEDEQRDYHDNVYRMWDHRSSVPLLRGIEKEFSDAVFDPNELKMILVPTNKDLSTEALMRLSMHPVRFVGVTRAPIPADGFMRAGGDFYNHDTRHYNSIYARLESYKRKHHLSESEMTQLRRMSDRWDAELKKALAQVTDPQLKAALDLVIFNLHHDQGFMTVPSTYQDPDATSWLRAQTGPLVTMMLYGLLKTSGQPLHFDQGFKHVNDAYKWLEQFWLARLPQEKTITDKGVG